MAVKVLVTGSDGFLGKNLIQHLAERSDIEIVTFTREDSPSGLKSKLVGVDFVFHFAGVNRPHSENDFTLVNIGLTKTLCDEIAAIERKIPILFASSTQAVQDNPYGLSKRGAEDILLSASESCGIPVYLFRLPNVFGKWCRPNYNSVVATYCHNIARDLPIHISDPQTMLTLVFVDDVMNRFLRILYDQEPAQDPEGVEKIFPQYRISLGELAKQIESFKRSRATLMVGPVGIGLVRALYSTYVSYLPASAFSYPLPTYVDERGVFAEMLKTQDAGQFSFFTAYPGVTRGGHYHHAKTEKFLVIRGEARFRFRNMLTNERHEIITNGNAVQIVETIPGWTHDVTNIGHDEMIVMLWANENFDPQHPDTIACKV